MFNSNDRFLFIAKIFNYVVIIFFAIAIIAASVIYFVAEDITSGFVTLGYGGVLLCLYYLFTMLAFSTIVDIKLIRNKLYDVDQPEITNFWRKSYSSFVQNDFTANDANDKRVKKYEALTALNDALKKGAITQEEYEEQKRQILED